MTLLPVEVALTRVIAAVPAPLGERIPLAQANGRALLEDVVARFDQPPFDASAMDGYAVRASDVAPGKNLAIIGVAQAGQQFEGFVSQGQCVRIFTGAPVPRGADAVIMQEEAHVEGNTARFPSPPPIGRSIRPAGMDFTRGQVVLEAGIRLTPASLSLAAAAGHGDVFVGRRPRVALLATGDELVPPGETPQTSQIVSSNSIGLGALVSPFAAAVIDLGIASDMREDIEKALNAALDLGADVIVTTGGASVGDRDCVREVLQAIGVDMEFWKIAMRPGKPLMFGRKDGTLVFGLPGNPVSALVTAHLFVLPALRRFVGLSEPDLQRLPLAAPTPPNSARRHFLRGRVETSGDGTTKVQPILETDSGHLSSLAAADILIVQPENDPGQPSDAMVEVRPLWVK